MKTTKKHYVIINGLKFVKNNGLLILAEPVKNIFGQFHTYKHKQI